MGNHEQGAPFGRVGQSPCKIVNYFSKLLVLAAVYAQSCGLLVLSHSIAASQRSILQAMIKMFDPVLTWAARKYQAAVATELKKYGLRYEDLYDPQLNMVR